MPRKLSIADLAKETGLGNPESKHWFVALEEHVSADWDPTSHVVRLEPRYLDFQGENTNVWNIIAKIMVGLTKGEPFIAEGWRQFRSEKLFVEAAAKQEAAYLVELFPLPLPNHGHWGEKHNNIFQEDVSSFEQYRSLVLGKRIEFLRKQWRKHKPKITVCMGQVRAFEFRWLFDLIETPKLAGTQKQFQIFEDQRVVLTPFFNPRTGMGDSQVLELVKILKSFGKD